MVRQHASPSSSFTLIAHGQDAKWQRAIKKYKAAGDAIEYDDKYSAELKSEGRAIKKSCNLNLAAAYLKVGQAADARKACDKVRSQECLM